MPRDQCHADQHRHKRAVPAHAARKDVGGRGGGECRIGDRNLCRNRGKLEHAHQHQRNHGHGGEFDRDEPAREQQRASACVGVALRKDPHFQSGACAQQTQYQGGGAQAKQGVFNEPRQAQARQIGGQPGDRGKKKRVTCELTHQATARIPGEGPDCRNIDRWNCNTDDYRSQGQTRFPRQPMGECEKHVGVEAKGALYAGGELTRVGIEQGSGKIAERDARADRAQYRAERRPGLRRIDGCARDGCKQQCRKEHEIGKLFQDRPEGLIAKIAAVEHEPDRNQRQVGQKEPDGIHDE